MRTVYAVDDSGREILARLTVTEWNRVKAAEQASGRDAAGDLLQDLISRRPYLVVEDVMRSLLGLMLADGGHYHDEDLFRVARDALHITRTEFEHVLNRARQLGFVVSPEDNEPGDGD